MAGADDMVASRRNMSLLVTWTHSNIVGVQAMDDEHAIMMDAMNELRSTLVSGRRRST
jgi:hypothetical protein